jgi:gamma-glutamylaminecyclotransferase
MQTPADGETVTLFVYGTLMRGGVRHRMLDGQRFLGPARTRPLYALLDLGAYPGLVRRETGGRAVYGELYEVAVGLLPRLDTEEGAPTLYRREPVEIDGRDGPTVSYFYQRPTAGRPVCQGGRWVNREEPADDT